MRKGKVKGKKEREWRYEEGKVEGKEGEEKVKRGR